MYSHQVPAPSQAQPNTPPSAAACQGVARPTHAASRAMASSGSGQAAVWLMSGTTVLSGSGYVGNNPGTAWNVIAN